MRHYVILLLSGHNKNQWYYSRFLMYLVDSEPLKMRLTCSTLRIMQRCMPDRSAKVEEKRTCLFLKHVNRKYQHTVSDPQLFANTMPRCLVPVQPITIMNNEHCSVEFYRSDEELVLQNDCRIFNNGKAIRGNMFNTRIAILAVRDS
jgi:hypothetical protein